MGINDETELILDRHLDGDFYCAAAHADAPTEQELIEVASRYGCRLPPEFLAHSCGPLSGIYVEVKENVWPRPKAYDVGPFWSFLYAVFVYGLAPEIPDWMNIDLAAAEFLSSTGQSRVPCLKIVGDADIYVFDSDGKISQWRHETDEFDPYAGSFFDLLEQEVGQLRQRKDQKVAALRG